MHHVFISYNRQDAGWVNEVVRGLTASGHDVWIDHEDIPVSLPWLQEVSDAISAADVFLVCDSERWRRSEHCRTEHTLARDGGKRIVSVPVGGSAADAVARVGEACRSLPDAARRRVELTVRARDWDRAGRPGGALVSRRQARRLHAGAGTAPPTTPVERAFLRASRSRARRRTVMATLVGVVLTLSLVTFAVFSAAQTRITTANNSQAAAYMLVEQLREREDNDPVKALSAAARLGVSEAASNAIYVSRAFLTRLPVDAFTVPAVAPRFAADPVGAQVLVTDGAGRMWARAARAAADRRARAIVGRVAERRSPRQVTARVDGPGGAVSVYRGGVLFRRIIFGRHPRALSVSPNGRELAVAVGNSVDIADVALGRTRTTLRGRGDTFRDVAWSRDGNRVWATGRKQVVSWAVRDGTVLRDTPGRRFEALLPAEAPGAVWVVAASGGLEKLDVQTGRHLAFLRVQGVVSSGGGAADGSVAALSGKRGLWIVPLRGGAPRLVSVPGCRLGRPAFARPSIVHVACLDGPVLTIDVRSGRVVRRLRVSPSGAFTAKPLPGSDAVLVSDVLGLLYVATPDGRVREIYRNQCGGSITRIATSPDGRVVAPVGAGTSGSCTRRLVRVGPDPGSAASWQADTLFDGDLDSHVAEAAAVSRGGNVFVYGFEDGTVMLHPTENLIPTRRITTVVGEIRDMLVTPDNRLLVATAAGTLQRLDLCEACLSDRSMAREAARIVARQIQLGIAKKAR